MHAQRLFGRSVGDSKRRTVGDAGNAVSLSHAVAIVVAPASSFQQRQSCRRVVPPGGQPLTSVEGMFGRHVAVQHLAGRPQQRVHNSLPICAQRYCLSHSHVLKEVRAVVAFRGGDAEGQEFPAGVVGQ